MDNNTITQDMFIKKMKRQKRWIRLEQIGLFILLLLLWELTTRFGILDSFIFSSPSRIVKTVIEMQSNGTLLVHIGTTLWETLVSFLLVMVLGVMISLLLWLVPTLSKILEPYLVMLNSLPKSALAPLLIVWLGNGVTTIIVAGISVAIFGSILTLYTGFCQMDLEKMKLIYTLGGTKKTVVTKVLLPGSIPMLISNAKVNIGLCLVGVIIGEFLAARQGLGYLIIYGSQVFQLDLVLMSIVILCIIAMILYHIINWIEKKYLKQKCG